MNTTLKEGLHLAQQIKMNLPDLSEDLKVVLCPPFISLEVIASLFEQSPVQLGAQNLHQEDNGAYTGEISGLMLKDYCQYVIIGHSERRQFFQESNEIVASKVRAARRHQLTPIVCIGENQAEYEAKQTFSVLESQLHESLQPLDAEQAGDLLLAYEPAWAIGSDLTPNKQEVEQIAKFIQATVQDMVDEPELTVPVLYGGSVKPFNVADFTSLPHVDGVLVGGASLDAEIFTEIIAKIKAYSG